MPSETFLASTLKMKTQYNNNTLVFSHSRDVTRASRADLEEVFKDTATQRRLFPSAVLVRDSQSFGVSPEFADFNIPLILADRLDAMFMTRDVTGSAITSLSFGTIILSSVKRDIVRHTIDYYGSANPDVIRGHMIAHLLRTAEYMRHRTSANVVASPVFLPGSVDDVIDFHRDVASCFEHESLGFRNDPLVFREQCVAITKQDPRTEAGLSHKL